MIKFNEIDELLGFTDFRTFEKETNDYIYYADMNKDTVIKSIEHEYKDLLNYYLFDSWYIAIYED